MQNITWKATLDTLNALLAAAPPQRCTVLAPVASALRTHGDILDKFLEANADEIRAARAECKAKEDAHAAADAAWKAALCAPGGAWAEAERAVRAVEGAGAHTSPAVFDVDALQSLLERADAALKSSVSSVARGWVLEFIARLEAEVKHRPRAPSSSDSPHVLQLLAAHEANLEGAMRDAEAAIAFLRAE